MRNHQGRIDDLRSVWGPAGPWDGPGVPLHAVFAHTAVRCPDKTAIVCEGKSWSYQETDDLVRRTTAALRGRGLRRGDRCAIAAQNSPELIVLFYALASAGCITVWVNPGYRGSELLFPLENTGARVLLVDGPGPVLEQVAEAKRVGELAELRRVIVRGEGERRDSGEAAADSWGCVGLEVEYWSAFISSGSAELTQPVEPRDDDYVMVIHTSGATGIPKGAPSTHGQVVEQGFHYARAMRNGPDDVFLGALPMFHSFGFICLLIQPFQLGATLVVMPQWDTGVALRLIAEERVTVHPAAPTNYLLEMAHPDFARSDLSSLRAGLISGYVPPREIFTQIEAGYPGMWLCNFWGSSETGPGLISPFDSPPEKRYLTVGRPVLGEEARIVDPETGHAVRVGEPGELQVRGPNVIREYWNDPEETHRHLEPDGWFHTGDLARADEDGFFTIVGRLKDQINRGGLKITPHDLEVEIEKYPGVSQVCVIGIPNPVLGESICACVIPQAGAHVDLLELRAFLSQRVARNHLPDELCLLDEFPKLSGGVKIDKYGPRGLRAIVLARQDRQVFRKPR